MKNYKYIGLLLLSIGFASCDVNNDLDPILEEVKPQVNLDANGLDFSNYVSIGASFTAGFTDGALFKAGQENSFPNILATKFKAADGGDFNQPLMGDNIGGFVTGSTVVQPPRLVFNPVTRTPARLGATPTTSLTARADGSSFNNYGIPGAKSFHLTFAGYATLNPYFGRMASSPTTTVLADALAQKPTFFTLSEIGGNDVLSYAISGGSGVDQSPSTTNPTGNLNPATYGLNDITNPLVFDNVFKGMVTALTAGGAKGVIATVPNINLLPYFTTVPHNPLNPNDKKTGPALKAQIPLLNSVFGAINKIYVGAGEPERAIIFSETKTNPVVIFDEDATDLSVAITTTLGKSPTFVPFVQSLGLPAAAAPLVAGLLGKQYGKARSATVKDLLVLPSSSVIGTVNKTVAGSLITQSGGLLPATLAGQFSAEGITLPLADQWVLTPQEQEAIKNATVAYNKTITETANANKNLALIDLNAILQEASNGIQFDNYTMTTSLVTGGLVSLDGIHLTARGYALMANKMLAAIDAKFGSNFTKATDGLAKADDYPTNYSPTLK
ncbi:G-D-S-L family lipolytic protein [Polaribacter cellanae]|uniref:G-D-S-L family lipolytic protein n=1 Tax=Polaribacter cellanae TaxID=2818493 RepID=A0A975H5D7_9FLAO|nr:G-D-S-L family lipolytic protein [Polaribacter cellanae]QTE21287.1 G-D-S-L family lipolytic protein [Polaribacter cellanae]